MVNQVDFIVRNGLQVTTNAVIGSYAMVNPAPVNGLIVSGNVGIGTASPVQKLQVVGNIQITNTAGTLSGIYFPDGTYQATSASSYSTPPGGSSGSIQYNNGGAFGGASTFVYHSGNAHVGIGTNQANYTLQVVATDGPALFSTLNGSNYQIGIGTATGNATVGYNALSQYGYLTTGVNQATPALVFTQGGRIGIGNATPTSNLDVKGSMAIGSYAGVSTPPSNSLIISGNIGVGITNPTISKIDVQAEASQLGLRIKNDSTSPGGFVTFVEGASNQSKFSIDSQGTVTTGGWNGNVIAPGYGGTGLSSYASGDMIYATGSNTLSKLSIGTRDQVLLAGLIDPYWGSISLSNNTTVSGVLPIAKGGTNVTSFSGNAIVVTSSNGLVMTSVTSATNAAVVFNNSGVPTAVTGGPYTYLTTGAGGGALSFSNINLQFGVGSSVLQVSNGGTGIPNIPQYAFLYGSANTSVMSTLVSAATSALVTGATNAPQWASGTTANRVLRTDGTNITFSQVVLTSDVSGVLPVANGGTGTSTQFTLGSVIFAGTSGVYTQDNANFFWDDTNNRLGLGTASPVTTLDVNGAATIRNGANIVAGGLYVQSGVGNFAGAVIADSLTSNSYVRTAFLNATTSANVAGLTSNTTIIVNGTTDSTSTSTGALIVAGGVGIAKTLWVGNAAFIQGNLTVGGNLIVSGNVTYINTNVTTMEDPVIALGTGPNGANLTVADTYDRGLEFHYYSGGADRYGFMGWQNSTGKFTYIANATGNLTSQVYTGPFGDAQFGNITISGGLNTPIPSTSTTTGALVIGGTGGIGVGGNIYAGGSINTTGNITAGNLTVTGTLNAHSNSATNASNVVITATSTNATFYPAFVEATSGNLGIRVDSTLTYNPSTDALTAGQFIPTSSTAPTNGMYLPAANSVALATNSTFRMRIDPNGNVGIAQSNPIFRLDVTGNSLATTSNAQTLLARFSNSNPGNTAAIEITDTRNQVGGDSWMSAGHRLQQRIDNTWMGYIQFNGSSSNVGVGTTNTYGITFGTGDSTIGPNDVQERMRITATGRVGIGTEAPSQLLDVNGSALFRSNLRSLSTTASTSTGTGALVIDGGAGIAGTVNAGQFITENAIRGGNLSITNTTAATSTTTGALVVAGGMGLAGNAFVGGNIGIGTSSTQGYRLYTRGNSKVTGSVDVDISFLGQPNDTATTPSFAWTGDQSTGMFRPSAGNIGFSTNGIERVRISTDGFVGVGTGLPAAKLQVAGNTIVSNVMLYSGFSYGGGNLDVSALEANLTSVAVSNDGTMLYALGNSTDRILAYSMPTPWEISTATYIGQSASTTAQNQQPSGLTFKPDGRRAWITGTAASIGTVHEYDLATPWEVTSGFTYTGNVLVTTALAPAPHATVWRSDGQRLFVLNQSLSGTAPRSVIEYEAATPWTIGSMSNVAVRTFNVAVQEANPLGLSFTNDGTRMFIAGSNGDDITIYDLSMPWNIDTASYRTEYSLSGLVSNITLPGDMFVSPDGSRLYVTNDVGTGTGNVMVYQFEMPTSTMDVVGTTRLAGSTYVYQDLSVYGKFLVGSSSSLLGNVGIGTSTASQPLDVNGAALFRSNLQSLSTTAATSTSTGALVVAGGIGVGGNIYAGGTIYGTVNTAINASNVVITNTTTNATFYPAFVEATTGNLGIRVDSMLTYNPSTEVLTIGGDVLIANRARAGNLSITNTTVSTTTTSGALTVAGGVGIVGNLTVGNAGRFGNIYVGNSTASTDSASGALVVAGGVGIGGALYVGGIIDAQSIDGTAIGNLNPSTGQFTSLVVQGSANVNVLRSNSTISGNSFIVSGNVKTGISTTGSVTIDSFDALTYRTAHYIAQVTDNTSSPLRYYSTQIMVMHDGPAPTGGTANVYVSEYNMMYSNVVLGTFDATFVGAANVVNLTMTPINTNNMTVRLMRSTVAN